jgi:hypothetical protein
MRLIFEIRRRLESVHQATRGGETRETPPSRPFEDQGKRGGYNFVWIFFRDDPTEVIVSTKSMGRTGSWLGDASCMRDGDMEDYAERLNAEVLRSEHRGRGDSWESEEKANPSSLGMTV